MAQTSQICVLTPQGMAGIAVVRIAGDLVTPFLQQHFSKTASQDKCIHGDLLDSQKQTIDDPVVVLIHNRMADINLHGGVWVVQKTLDIAVHFGFTLVDSIPDAIQFDFIEHDIQQSLPAARTTQALRLLLSQRAAWIDLLEHKNPKLVELALEDKSLWYLLNPPTVAIVGAPNAGKSTLANQLFAQKRSIEADLPGTTRDWVGEEANIDGLIIKLIDTPGLRSTTDAIEHAAIQNSLDVIQKADFVIRVISPDTMDQMDASIPKTTIPMLTVFNKCDQPCDQTIKENWLNISAKTGQGINELRIFIRNQFWCTNLTSPHARCWTEKQRQLLNLV